MIDIKPIPELTLERVNEVIRTIQEALAELEKQLAKSPPQQLR